MEIIIKGLPLQLLPEKAIYIEKNKTLIISDMHLGKVTHFRKSGIAIPAASQGTGLQKLEEIIVRYQPGQVWFLGDLFHSEHNVIWEYFVAYVHSQKNIAFTLVRGNHDILTEQQYADVGLEVVDFLNFENILFSHEPNDVIDDDIYNIAGHVHPGINLKGKGKQYLRLPCFKFGLYNGLLPAFGHFTGLHTVQPVKGDRIYAIGDGKIFEFSY